MNRNVRAARLLCRLRESPSRRRSRHGENGSALLVVMLLATAAVAVSAALIDRAALVAAELGARRAVLCARYAALGGLALGGPASDTAALVGDRVESLVVSRVRLSSSWCVLRSAASCDGSTRTLDRTIDVAACDSTTP